MSSRKFDITEAYIQALQALQENENLTKLNKVFESKLDEKFTVDTFNNKYKPQEKINVNADGSVSAGNFILRGSGITKRVGAILSDNKLRIDNENIHIDFDGNDIKVYGPYWFTSDFEDNEEFRTKVTKAVKDLYNDMKKLQQPAEKKSERT